MTTTDTAARRCTATARRTGQHCQAWPIKGATVCRVHGGRAPQVKAAAARRLEEAKARRAIRGMLIEPVTDPLTALTEIAGEILAWKDYLAAQVDALREMVTYDDKGAEQVRALLAAYERGLDRSVTALATIAKLNIDERLVRLEEAHVMLVVRAVDAGLARIGVAGPAALEARRVIAAELRRTETVDAEVVRRNARPQAGDDSATDRSGAVAPRRGDLSR